MLMACRRNYSCWVLVIVRLVRDVETTIYCLHKRQKAEGVVP